VPCKPSNMSNRASQDAIRQQLDSLPKIEGPILKARHVARWQPPRYPRAKLEKPPSRWAKKYAELTGGQAVGMRGKRPEERLAQLIDELRARYTIGYRPSDTQPAGMFRKITVKPAPSSSLRTSGWKVLACEGYYRKENMAARRAVANVIVRGWPIVVLSAISPAFPAIRFKTLLPPRGSACWATQLFPARAASYAR
jgi:hypothetical protein